MYKLIGFTSIMEQIFNVQVRQKNLPNIWGEIFHPGFVRDFSVQFLQDSAYLNSWLFGPNSFGFL